MKSIFIHQQFDTFSWSRRFQFPHSLQVSWYDTLSPTSYYLIGPRPCLTSTTSRSRRTRAKSDGPTHIPSPNVALFALYSRFHYSWRITEALSQRRRKGGGKEGEISQGRVIQKACFCVMGPKYPGRTRPHDQEPEWHSGCPESLETACDGSCSNRFQAHRPFESLMTHFLEGKFVLWVIHLLVRGKMIHAAAQVYIIRIHSVTFRRRRMKGETIRHRSFSSVDRASAS